MTFRTSVVAAAMTLVTAAVVFGQAEITGRVAGVVSDPSGALIPGVSVKVEGPTLFAPRTTITAEDASYFIDKLPPGTYKVTYTFPGFKTVERGDVLVRANFTATLNVVLEVGAVEETLMVTEAAPVVDVRSATMATTFDAALLKEIPHGRDTWSMLAQVPGLTPARFDIGGTESFQQTGSNLHGAAGQTVYNVNGLNLNWPGGNGSATAFYFDNDSFQEVQVVTDAAQPEIGVGGVQINMITRQGSNELHGSLKGYYTTHALTSAPKYPIFNNRPVESGTTITMMRDVNAQAGFPIFRDKFWFYGSFRAYHINLAVPAVKRQDGSAIQDTNLQRDTTARADFNITDRQKLTLIWLYNDINRYFRPGGATFVDDVATGLQLEHAWVGQMQWTYTPTANLVLDSRFGNMTLHFPQAYQKEVRPGTLAVIDTILNTAKYARTAGATLNHTWHARGAQGLSYFRGGFLGGSHNLRAGYEYARMSNGNRVDMYGDLNVRLANGQPLDVVLFNTPRRSLEQSHETAMYLQDSFAIKRLTINAGIRFDRFLTFLPEQSSPAGTWYPARSFPRSNNIVEWNDFSPRIGVAYDVTGQGRAVIRGSYSQNVLLQGSNLAAGLNPNGALSCRHTFTALGPNNQPLGINPTPIPQSCSGGRLTNVADNLTRPYSRQGSIGYEQQIFGDVSAGIGYYYRTTLNQFTTINRSAVPSDYSPLTVTNPVTNQPLTIYNLSPAKTGLTDSLVQNFAELNNNAYHGLEINATKRLRNNWQLLGGFTVQRKRGDGSGNLNDPNVDIFRKNIILDTDSTYVFKLSGTYNLPFGITTSGNFQHYTGYVFTPQALFRSGTNSAGATVNLTQGSVTVPLIPRGDQRLPDVNVLNWRFGYRKTIADRYRLDPTLDLYNVFNTNTVTGLVNDIGPNFRRPSSILSQRFVKFGLNIEF